MKKIITSILVFASTLAYCQVNSPWTQYYQTPYLQNPALSGIEGYTDIKLGFKRQWAAFDGAPKDYFVGVNHAFGNNSSNETDSANTDATMKPHRKMGLSGYLAASDYNAMSNIQTGVAYAIHIPITERYQLSFGLAATYNSTKAQTDNLIVRDKQDAFYLNLVNAGGAVNYFNLDAGALIYSSHFYAGYTAIRLMRTRLTDDISGKTESSVRHTMLIGYSHTVNADWEVQPSALMRLENGVERFYNINLKARYKALLWGGIGFSPERSLSVLAGYQLKTSLTFSYSYDINIGAVNTASPGSHELIVGIMPFNKTGRRTFFW